MSSRPFRPLPLVLALSLAWSATALQAQTATAATPAADAGAPGTTQSFQLRAQPLAEALNHWARQTRMQLLVQQSLVVGKQAPAVVGTLSPREALAQLLAGSGLRAL